MTRIDDRLAAGEVVIMDGAIATELWDRGVPISHGAPGRWSLVANVEKPESVRSLARDYIAAGADVISANTFGSGPANMEDDGISDRFEEVNRAAVQACLDARAEAGAPDVAVAGVIMAGGAGRSDIGSYGEFARVLADAGADLIAVEMIGTLADGTEAVQAVQATGLPVWVGLSAVRDADNGLVTENIVGTKEDLGPVVAGLAALKPDVMTVMHTEFEDTEDVIRLIREHFDGPIGAYPHRGTVEFEGEFEFERDQGDSEEFPPMKGWKIPDTTPEEFAALGKGWIDAGAQIVGGCCGLGVAHVAALSKAVAGSSVAR